MATERIFSGLAAERWSGVVENTIQMSSGASLAITFFAERSCFQLFTYLGRKILPFLVVFFSSFPKSRLTRSKKNLSWTYILKKNSVFILKVLGKINKLLFCLFVDNSLPLVQTAIFKSKRQFWKRKSFETKIQYCQETQKAAQHILWGCQNRIEHYQRNNLREKINYEKTSMLLLCPRPWRVKLFIFGAKAKQIAQTWPNNNPRISFFWTRI